MEVGDVVVIDRTGIDQLVISLQARGLRTIGPVVRDGAVVHGDVSGSADMPIGWHDHQEPGAYRLHHDDDPRIFAWAVGPQSLKTEVFPSRTVVWRSDGPVDAETSPPTRAPTRSANPHEPRLSVPDPASWRPWTCSTPSWPPGPSPTPAT